MIVQVIYITYSAGTEDNNFYYRDGEIGSAEAESTPPRQEHYRVCSYDCSSLRHEGETEQLL